MVDETIPARGNRAGSGRVRVQIGLAAVGVIAASAGEGAALRAAVWVDSLLVRRVRADKPGLVEEPDGRVRAREIARVGRGGYRVRASHGLPAGKVPRGIETGDGIRGAIHVHRWT